jgi:hypothetical protein
VQSQRWLNQSQPQTLFIATWLLYANAAFAVLDFVRFPRPLLGTVWFLYFAVQIGGGILAGWGIANDKRLGYYTGIAVAVAPFALRTYLIGNPLDADTITLLFEIALVVLLLHPQSRDYQKIWFK